MTKFLFDPPPPPAVPIAGLDVLFPVARIFCVGRNYEDHAKEMGHVSIARSRSISPRARPL